MSTLSLSRRLIAYPPCQIRSNNCFYRLASTAWPLSLVKPRCLSSVLHRASSSSTRWKSRQSRDRFAKEARVQGLKSRAAFKLLELDEKYRLFKRGHTVVDLGFAPGSWSQVAISRVSPGGRVVGIDIIPAQPPRGVSTIQGNFLSPEVQAEVRRYVRDRDLGRAWTNQRAVDEEENHSSNGEEVVVEEGSYFERESSARMSDSAESEGTIGGTSDDTSSKVTDRLSQKQRDERDGRVVDVVLSDMSAPWEQTAGFYIRSLTEPHIRMMNTSGMPFRDHVGSMVRLRYGHPFTMFFTEDGNRSYVKQHWHFASIHCEQEAISSANSTKAQKTKLLKRGSGESKEAYFVALKRKSEPTREEVFAD
ncbi:MAG: 2' O-ribose methyltransferase [Bathelium mastoideum]|nr:MAG: 2' O-ribose methyltransferase [Bathelium mastoideum]